MDIHRFEKVWFVAALVIIVLFIGTIVYGALGAGVAMVGDGGVTVDPADPASSEEFREPGVYETDDGVEVYVIARQFLFQPGTAEPIEVPADEEVTFHVASGDVTHGFHVVGTNVNTMVIPGQVAEMTVEFDEPGTYYVVCHEYCGSGHHDMEGTIEVLPSGQEVSDA